MEKIIISKNLYAHPLSMNRIILIFSLSLVLAGCSASRQRRLHKNIVTIINSRQFKNQFTGYIVFDPITKDTISNYNSEKYFLPASNTKIFTLYTALQLLADRIPSIKYISQNDTLYVEGTGDPSALHPFFKDSTLLHFLKKAKNIALHLNNFDGNSFGPGWAWEDYDHYYAPERNSLPLYGNVTFISNIDSLRIIPSYFKDSIVFSTAAKKRKLHQNVFYFDSLRKDTLEVPIITYANLTKELLETATHKKIELVSEMPAGKKEVLYGILSDSLYKRMMYESDNFIAEQLLIVSSSTLNDTINSTIARDHILVNQLSNLRQPPRWVDGSGLSRYNLFTPESMMIVLQKMYAELPKDRLFSLFPAGGKKGTLIDLFKGNPKPYVFAKSGSMGNTYCLSGYLLTNSGKTLIFSFMNNHYRQSTNNIKKEMTSIFELLRDTY
ncbi:D-alanyl-D-alanine carboxypeptidase/D-alanyl-D-alanine-endopeptidase [Sediminicola arcticus]|jgi:D-alanyl-D-alanine carboxypeptidase/D-alanyl-D-alanine-endopeptidase (penicillin-binding protein 4)|uniref:D-alanyl-D-alanine carboxypeptidase n=1 Tax=Sediminicola arcticus TaxID=1574308 RepID=A0ABV2SX19_9FLAO